MATAANLNDVQPEGFFTRRLSDADPAVADAIRAELEREQTQIELIASENIVSRAVPKAGIGADQQMRRLYGGGLTRGEAVRAGETLATTAPAMVGSRRTTYSRIRAKGQRSGDAGSCRPATPSRHEPGSGGNLTHALRRAGKWFKPSVRRRPTISSIRRVGGDKEPRQPDHRRRVGYQRIPDFARYRDRDEVGACVVEWRLRGLVAAGEHDAFGHARSSHHPQALRGPRGGMCDR